MQRTHGFGAEDLRVFCEVARQESFTAAATTLSYTQSGVSRRIAALERAIGGALFERLPRGVRLTPAGRAFRQHAVELLTRLDLALADVDAIRTGGGGPLRIGAFPTANVSLVPGVLRHMRQDRPDVELTVTEGLSADLLDLVRTGGLDLAVATDYPTGLVDGADLHLVDLGEDPLLIALPRGHPSTAGSTGDETLDLADLAGETWIAAGPSGVDTMLTMACLSAGFTPQVDITVRSWVAKLGFVAAGLGVTVVPELAVDAGRGDIVLRSARPAMPARRVYAALPSAEPLTAATHVVDLLRAGLTTGPLSP